MHDILAKRPKTTTAMSLPISPRLGPHPEDTKTVKAAWKTIQAAQAKLDRIQEQMGSSDECEEAGVYQPGTRVFKAIMVVETAHKKRMAQAKAEAASSKVQAVSRPPKTSTAAQTAPANKNATPPAKDQVDKVHKKAKTTTSMPSHPSSSSSGRA